MLKVFSVKSMMEIEPPNYKKSFFVSLMSVLLIASLAICLFAGQAMGQSENDVAPLSNARVIISVIVTTGIIILIISCVTKAVRRNTTKINSSNKIKPLPNVIGRVFLTLLTWFFYGAYSNAEYAEKFNIMSRRVLNKEANIKFRATLFSTLLAFSYFIIIFAIVNVFLLNPSVYAAIFNLDGMALGTALGEGFAGLGLLFKGTWIAIVLAAEILCLVSVVPLVGILDKPMRRTSIALLKYYVENSETYPNACAYTLNEYASWKGLFSTSDLNYKSFKLLVKCYNEEHGFDRSWEF